MFCLLLTEALKTQQTKKGSPVDAVRNPFGCPLKRCGLHIIGDYKFRLKKDDANVG